MEIISLILIAATWAGTHAIMLGYTGLNSKRDAIVTGMLNGVPIDAAYRKHLFTNDWLPLKFGLGLVALIFVVVIASIPLLVSEEEIVSAMLLLWTRLKQVVEPSSAVTLAAVLRNRALFSEQRVGLVLTGGNVDPGNLPFKPAI